MQTETPKKRHAKPRKVWFDADEQDAQEWFNAQLVAGIKPEITRQSLVEWAEQRRVIPQGLSAMPGLFSWDVTPYLEDIADDLSETSPIREVAVMKGAQIGFTVGILENWMLYTIDQAPGPMLYVAQSQQAAEQNMAERIGPAIERSGLGHKIFAQVKATGSRQTGNTNESKQFPGGRLRAIGPNVGARLRTDSYQKGSFDELDAWQQEIGTTGGKRKSEGSTLDILRQRFATFMTTMKICYGSTPTEAATSLIEPLYELGDQRRYNVPCKHCGELQPLEWENLRYEVDDRGVLIEESVHYECRACKGHWKNDDKVEFLKSQRQGGRALWVPTTTARRPFMHSYHISALYSPVGFRPWEDICRESVEAGTDPLKLQTLWNTGLGRTWVVKGLTPDYAKVMANREAITEGEWGWEIGQWPDGALIWTIGADTQDDRIEAEVVAWGRNQVSWSLGYHVFHGDTADENSEAWTGLAELMSRDYGGLPCALALIDSQGHRSTEVYNFCERYAHDRAQLMPCAGDGPKSDRRMFSLYHMTGYATQRADLQVDKLKAEFYGYLAKGMPESGMEPRGFCRFPREYGKSYFQGLMSEERKPVRLSSGRTVMRWSKLKGITRNEPLDCRVYAMGALYVFKERFKESLGLDKDVEMTWEDFWDLTESSLRS